MNVEEQLAARVEGSVVVMGIGNPMRGDDAAGSLVARRITPRPGVCVIDAEDVPEAHVAAAVRRQPDTIILIDAVDFGSTPGAIAFLERDQLANYWPTTHRTPLTFLIGILEEATRARVFAIGIQPGRTGLLEPVSNAVAASVGAVAGLLNEALARNRAAAGPVPASSRVGEAPA
ncbi:MAG: hydrogenase 3 maturation endopeptidase HyCI [Bryobacteraceae bacterium]|nr:hydrogenase 3 maturation endopeptidase HyCI [Bryobacteraceae bacterium]